MKGSFVVAIILSAFAFGSGVVHGQSNGLQIHGHELVRGSRLMVKTNALGGQMEILAKKFYRTTHENRNGDKVHTFFPVEFRAIATGTQESTYQSVPVDYGSGWFMRTKVQAELNQTTEVSIEPTTIDLGDFATDAELTGQAMDRLKSAEQMRRAAALSPVSIRIVETGGDQPAEVEIQVTSPSLKALPGYRVTHQPLSKLKESYTNFPLKDGVPSESKPTEHSRDYTVPIGIQIGGAIGSGEAGHSNQLPPQLAFEDSEIRSVGSMTGRRILASGSSKVPSKVRLIPGSKGGFADTEVSVDWSFSAGEPTKAGYLTASKPDNESWLPEVGAKRTFEVHLKDPSIVEGVRFFLEQVSNHTGIAINAGTQSLTKGARQSLTETVLAEFAEGSTKLSWTRTYHTYPEVDADSAPDLSFSEGKLQFDAGQVSEVVKAEVEVHDWAASGSIRAEIKLEGIWEEIAAKGAEKTDNEVSLAFPIDKNGNGIADAFDAQAGQAKDSDMLSLFEEYRGAYTHGKHQRFSPTRNEVFIIDYTQKLSTTNRKKLAKPLADFNTDLIFLRTSEHRRETIGKDAQALVIESMNANAVPQILMFENAHSQIEGWRALRPRSQMRTVFLHGKIQEKLLAEDLTRLLNLTP